MTKIFEELKKRVALDWTILLVGWQGFGPYRSLVTPFDIAQFALERLENEQEPSLDVIELATTDAGADEMGNRLGRMASPDRADHEAAKRKWIAVLLDDKLQSLPSDPLYGLLELTEFWADLGFPSYSPHQVQGKGNATIPQDYYTETNFRKVLDENRRWINTECPRRQPQHDQVPGEP
jgi:hypothetical protein